MLALVFWKGVPELKWLLSWLGLEQFTRLLVIAPTVSASRALARFDDDVLDRGIMRSARGVAWSAQSFARFDTRGVDGAVEGLATQSRRLGRLARRPQTGRLHQYYAQITVTIGVLFILILVVR